MPVLEVCVDAEIFLEHRGVRVYHVYRDDTVNEGVRCYWYGLSPDCSECDLAFDVRDVAAHLGLSPNLPAEEILCAAIDRALDGRPEDCGKAFAECWEHRSSEPPDPLGPLAESGLVTEELRGALALLLGFYKENRDRADSAEVSRLDEAAALVSRLV